MAAAARHQQRAAAKSGISSLNSNIKRNDGSGMKISMAASWRKIMTARLPPLIMARRHHQRKRKIIRKSGIVAYQSSIDNGENGM